MTTATVPQRATLRARISQFFHAEEVPYGLALLRMCLPVAILADAIPRWIWVREIYSTDGTPMPLWTSYGTPALFPAAPSVIAIALHSIMIFTLVATMVGWRTRLSLATSFVIYTYFCLLDSVSTTTKYTVIATHLLLLLSISRCGAIWSIDSLLARRRERDAGISNEAALAARRSPIWPTRLVQLLIGIVYFGASFTKIHTPAFFTGDQVYHWLMTDYNSDHPLGHWMSMFPWFLAMTSYITIIWEVAFLFICWRGWGRICALGMGVGFHLMTLFLIGLYIFPMVCVPIYFAFFREDEYERFFSAIKRWQQKTGFANGIVAGLQRGFVRFAVPRNAIAWSQPVFFATMAVIATGGVGIERMVDPYGERRAEGPYTLNELDREFVEETLLAPAPPLRDVDKFNSLSLGTFTISGVLANNKTEFRQGEIMLTQAILAPPHEDMWVDFCLNDGDGKVIDMVGQPVTHDMLRTNCVFTLPGSLDPGEYAIVLKCAGKEVVRRKFTLLPGKSSVTASAN